MRLLLIPLILGVYGCGSTETATFQTSTEQLLSFSDHITPGFLQDHLEVISHDSLEGRGTAMPGQRRAANYLSDFYERLGFTPMGEEKSYFQPFDLNAIVTDSLVYTTYRIEGKDTLNIDRTTESGDSFGEYSRLFGGSVPLEGDIVFAGFGINDPERGVHHLDGVSLDEKWVLVFEEIPHTVDGDTLVNPEITSNRRLGILLRNYNVKGVLVIPVGSSDQYYEQARRFSRLVENPQNLSLSYLEGNRSSFGLGPGYKRISPALAAAILGLNDEMELSRTRQELTEEITEFRAKTTSHYLRYVPFQERRTVQSENVLAFLEGADPDLKKETVVLMAHYDHVGIGAPDETGDMIYNGADDNGSGTAGLMAVANALNEARRQGIKPKRSVLFLHVSAEEVGLLGSRYYSDHPVIPIEQTVANFNADMIGRSDPAHIGEGNTDYVYLIGGDIISSGLDSLVVAANEQTVGMQLNRYYNDLTDSNQFYRRSDHWNFGRLGVPFVFFFTGVHEDYHQPSDTVDKIDVEKYNRVVKLMFAATVKVANTDDRPVVDNQEFIDITTRMPR